MIPLRVALSLLVMTTLTLPFRAAGQERQWPPGTMFAGGTVGYFMNTQSHDVTYGSEEETITSLRVNPMFGFFVTQNLAVTGSVNLSADTRSIRYTEQGIGVVAHKQWKDEQAGIFLGLRLALPMVARISCYVAAEAGIALSSSPYLETVYSNEERYQEDSETRSVGLNLSGGVLVSLNRRVALDIGLRYSILKVDVDSEDEGDSGTLEMSAFSLGYFGLMAFF
ncbi:PorT family protein [Myxococcota bacterium]|nr:PorT family protein [Myxococcota bacterium]MBU1410911.1 PorT family protein [Myxococcota bacterium]